MKKRRHIPKAIEHDILIRNQSVCCICRKSGVQIHHIDGNPNNNTLSNLCVLCIEHHAQASSKTAMTKGLEPSLLRKYKKHWESVVATSVGVPKSRKRVEVSKGERASIRFEAKRTLFMLPSLNTDQEIRARMQYLWRLNLETNLRNYIIKEIQFLHWLMDAKHITIIAEELYDFFFHLVGPHKVPFYATDKKEMSQATELLLNLGDHAIMFGYKLVVMKSIVETLKHFDEIGKWYKYKKIQSHVQKTYQKLYKTYEEERKLNKSKALQATGRLLQRLLPPKPKAQR